MFSQNCVGPSKSQDEERSPDARSKFLLLSYLNTFFWYSFSLITLLIFYNIPYYDADKIEKTDWQYNSQTHIMRRKILKNPDDLRTLNEMMIGTLFFGLTTLFLLLSKQFSNIDRSKFEIHKQILKECRAFQEAKEVAHSEFVSYLSSQKFDNEVDSNIFGSLFNSSVKNLTNSEFVSCLSTLKFEKDKEKQMLHSLFKQNKENFETLRHADVDVVNSTASKTTLLANAAQIRYDTHYLKLLLSNENIDVNKVDVSRRPHRSPLSCAIETTNLEATNMLLARTDINVNKVDDENDEIRSPLHSAVFTGKPEFVSLLLERNNIDVNQYSNGKWTPLLSAIDKKNDEIVEMLLNRPDIDVNRAGAGGWTPLTLACNRGDFCPMVNLDFDSYRHKPEKWPILQRLLNHPGINLDQPRGAYNGLDKFFCSSLTPAGLARQNNLLFERTRFEEEVREIIRKGTHLK